MKLKLIGALYLLCILACSCSNSGNENKTTAPGRSTAHLVNHKATFLDSVAAQDDLPYAQLKQHLLDTSDFLSDWYFKGDTVYYPGADYCLAIINGNDHRVQSHRYLVVYKRNALKNAAAILVATDDDEDYSTDYSRTEYKIFTPRLFYTREIEHLRKTGTKTKVKVTDRFYEINKTGGINLLSKKPAGIVVPVFDPDGEIGEDN